MTNKSIIASALLAALSLTTLSGTAAAAEKPQWQWTVGAGVAASDDPWLDVKNNVSLFPIVSAEYGKWSFFGDGIVAYNWIDEDEYSLSVGLNYRNEAYDSDDLIGSKRSKNKVFEGYKAPDGDITFLVSGHWQLFSLALEQDISGKSKGLTADAGVHVPLLELGDRFSLEGRLGVHWQSSNYANHIYGIKGSQIDVSKGRTAYTPGSTTSYSIGLDATYAINEQWTGVAGYTYAKLDDKIEKSPLIGQDKVQNLYVGVVYTF